MHDIIDQLSAHLNIFDNTALEQSKLELEQQTSTAHFWETDTAQETMKELAAVTTELEEYQQLKRIHADLQDLAPLIEQTDQQSADYQAYQAEFTSLAQQATKLLEKIKVQQYLSGPYDAFGCLFAVHAGQGGTEAMDWAQMLERMYLRYFEQKNWQFQLLSKNMGEEAGIKAVEYQILGRYAYGMLKHERGTHRLVRLSPFNADHLRQTSFALVEVLPLLSATSSQLSIPDDQLEWKFSRSSGAGGQNVNKVNTAVELRHLPTGAVVKCQEERSQVQNKERALQKLKAILAQAEEEKRVATLAQEKGAHVHASWGSQIRNYVLHPYKLVKDTRTKVESSDAEAVLDGDIEPFIQAAIRL